MFSNGEKMKKHTLIYNLINILLLLTAALFFFFIYSNGELFVDSNVGYISIIAISVILVHFLKAIRLYFALYGIDIKFKDYLKIFCKVTPVSILLPYKSGELFRMYCYGIQTGNMLKGIITVVLDRFIDTIALLAMIVAVLAVLGGTITPLVYILIAFVVTVFLVFAMFPGTYKYWLKYLLKANATPKRITTLKLLNKINIVYNEIAFITKGRGIILLFLSLLAWTIEIGTVSILYKLNGSTDISGKISEYLSAALTGTQSVELKQFVFISVILMLSIYVIVTIFDLIATERK